MASGDASREPVPLRFPADDAQSTLSSLPHPVTPLVGRADVTTAAAKLLTQNGSRLLTLTGPGGVGKTRLAVRIAETVNGQFPDGVAFVALASLVDPALVLPAIARGVGLRPVGEGSLLARLTDLLAGRQVLLVIDNFEHVLAAAEAVAALLASSPSVTVLATSRVPLRLSSEQEFAVPPLALPATGTGDADALARNPAVALFVHRASAVNAGFTLNSANAAAVAEICRRLDGLPLAIELAAARTKLLAPEAMVARMAPMLPLLTGGPRDQPSRLRTMRDAIAWSYDLLTSDERRLFRRLGVFAGGCPLAATTWVMDDDPASTDPLVAPDPPLDLLAALVDHSLVQAATGVDGEPRFTMLKTVRAFGLEQLDRNHEGVATRARHADWCLALASRAHAAYQGRGPGSWGARLLQEIDNLRAALTSLEASDETVGLSRLAVDLAPLWADLGHEREGYRWLTRVLDQATHEPVAEIAAATLLASRLANALGDPATAHRLAATALAWATNDAAALADAHCILGHLARGRGDQAAARAEYADALARYQTLDDRSQVAYTLVQLAKLGDLGTVGQPGDPDDQERAAAHAEEALAIYRELGNTLGAARALHQLAYVTYKQRDYGRAASRTREALGLFWNDRNLTELAATFEDLADILGMTGQAEAAARFYGVAEGLRETSGVPMWTAYRDEYEREVDITRRALPPDRFTAAWDAGRAWPLPEAVAAALASAAEETPAPEPAGAAIDGLTAREADVLRLLATGQSNREIAEALSISPRTVKGHLTSIMSRLGLDSRTAVVAYAYRHGLLTRDPSDPSPSSL